jgi:hypothetical protein
MRIELTIKVDYLPGWGFQEGVRELLQNARDAQTEFDAPMSVRVRKGTSVLVIENEGCTMPYEALLLGHTSKVERSDLIGKFGEGFKLGILALLRNGHSVKIRNGSEVWEPVIAWSDKFSAKVLAFDISKGRKNEKRISIEVGGISEETYRDHIAPRFLWLDETASGLTPTKRVKTEHGSLLLADEFRGHVFVKGIHVETRTDLTVGYDFDEAEVDRDRRMIRSWDLQWKTRLVWQYALAERPDLFGSYSEILESNGEESKGLDAYGASRLPDEYVTHACETFVTRHGADAVPVGTLEESRAIEHFGKVGVIVAPPMRAVLESRMGTLEKVQEKLKNEVTRMYGWHELSEGRKKNLLRAVSLVAGVPDVGSATEIADMIDVVDFRSGSLQGIHTGGRVQLAARVLDDRAECLATLVHEVAHQAGGDGDKGHVGTIERIWSAIVDGMSS